MSAQIAGRGAERLPAHIALSLIPSLPRPALERLVQRLIDGLDDMDPDTDLEPNGDEQDANGAEDDWHNRTGTWEAFGAGCPIADAGEPDYRTSLPLLKTATVET